MYKLIFFSIIILGLSINPKRRVTSQDKRKAKEDTITYIRYDTIRNQSNQLIIKSFYLKDSVDYSEKRLFNFIIKRQEMIFLCGKKTVAIDLPVEKIYQKNHDNKIILMQKANVSTICLLNGNLQNLYYLELNSGCNTCGELFLVYSQTGRLLLSSYGPAFYSSALSLSKKYGINSYLKCNGKRHFIPLRNF